MLTQHRLLNLQGKSIVASKDDFLANWTSFANGMLDGLNWDNVFVAGGAILGSLVADKQKLGNDVDIFLYGLYDDDEANKKVCPLTQFSLTKSCAIFTRSSPQTPKAEVM